MDSTPRLIDDLRATGDVTEQVAEVGCQSDPGFRCHIQSFQNRWNRTGSRSLFAGNKLAGYPIQKFQLFRRRKFLEYRLCCVPMVSESSGLSRSQLLAAL